MRHVELHALVRDASAEEVFRTVPRWERYPELAPHVRSTEVHATLPEAVGSSSWELHFRSGLLRWTEQDTFLPDRLEIRFEQTDGDFDGFEGVWTLRQEGPDVSVVFTADFDFGIPSLASILDPIAERVIRETVAWALTGFFPGRTVLDTDVALDAAAAPGAG
ncbi:type II toxin-antitoxin system RatA family toxin [Streptomyces sp. NPDC058757]|uniref:type II toxin-antitoxin system RatA family toxin n=1 Tax=unclassified Streptomyces TaxID=2593676 RepID=UPI003682E7A5